MNDEVTNPLFTGLENDDDDGGGGTPSRLPAWFATLAAQFGARPPPAAPTIVFSPPQTAAAPPPIVTKSKGWSCRAVMIIIIITITATLVGVLAWVGVYNGSSEVESAGNKITSFLTRYAALQQHHLVLAYVDMYGDEPSASDVRVETTSLKSFARIAGSVDLATQRFDWSLRVNDAHAQLGARMTIALWVQRYDTTTHLLRHTTHSPLILCANLTTSTTCAGHVDKPPADLTTSDELDPHVLSLALYDVSHVTRVNQTTVPLWILPIVR
jgi:hypothetical protein